jgi:hypothetical protein
LNLKIGKSPGRRRKMLLAPGIPGSLYLKIQKIQISKVQKNKNKIPWCS